MLAEVENSTLPGWEADPSWSCVLQRLGPIHDVFLQLRKQLGIGFALNGGRAFQALGGRTETADVDFIISDLPAGRFAAFNRAWAAVPGFCWINGGLTDDARPRVDKVWSRAWGQGVFRGVVVDFELDPGRWEGNGRRVVSQRLHVANGHEWVVGENGMMLPLRYVIIGSRQWPVVSPESLLDDWGWTLLGTDCALHSGRFTSHQEGMQLALQALELEDRLTQLLVSSGGIAVG